MTSTTALGTTKASNSFVKRVYAVVKSFGNRLDSYRVIIANRKELVNVDCAIYRQQELINALGNDTQQASKANAKLLRLQDMRSRLTSDIVSLENYCFSF